MKIEIIHDVPVSPNFANRDAALVSAYPASTVTRADDLLCVYRNGTAKHSRDGVLLSQRSRDGGRTWSNPVTIHDAMNGEHPESVHTGVVAEAADGQTLAFFTTVDAIKADVYIFSEEGRALRQRMWVASSPDGGDSWSPPRELDLPGLPPNRYVGSRPLVTADGALILPIEATAPAGQQVMLAAISLDAGRTFAPPFPIAYDQTSQLGFGDGKFAELDDGSVIMLTWTYRHPSEETIAVHRCVSSDRGRTWSPPQPTDLVCQILAPAVLNNSQLIAAGTVRTVPEGIRLFAGHDAGQTWDHDHAIQLWDPRQLRITGQPLPLNAAADPDKGGLWDALPSFTFGTPDLIPLNDTDLLMTYYAIVNDITHIRACRFRLHP